MERFREVEIHSRAIPRREKRENSLQFTIAVVLDMCSKSDALSHVKDCVSIGQRLCLNRAKIAKKSGRVAVRFRGLTVEDLSS